ncbi:mercuric transporter MerT family protein [Noviherbaspirillum soli]|uniref:mercuric transporter MerT family protein n=1 Tax=Noviherbaspirillum soli TaxID=1064518 RepID=UPI00188C6A9B|nr:mercuric transporter MerT family protein [Noviherbaspirillum soli]
MPLNGKGMLAAGVLAAIGASLCCVAPLLLLMLGVSGAWIASLVATEPYRPALVAVALLFFALACRRLYFAPSPCIPGQVCMDLSVLRRQRILFWVAVLPTLALLAVPTVASFLL